MKNILKKHRLAIVISASCDLLIVIALILIYFLTPVRGNVAFFYIMIVAIALTMIASIAIALYFDIKAYRCVEENDIKVSSVVGDGVDQAYNFAQVGMAVIDNAGSVIWINDFLKIRMNDILDKNIYSYFPELLPLKEVNPDYAEETPRLEHEGKKYEVQFLKEARLVIFKDVTNEVDIYNYNLNQSPVVGFLELDNYFDVKMQTDSESEFARLTTEAFSKIQQFANENKCLLKSTSESKFVFITTYESYQKIAQEKFSIVDTISRLENRGFTLSMGIALGLPDYGQLSAMASSALSVALSRGGDQSVVARFGQPLSYYGGKSDLQPSRNRVKLRTSAESFFTIIKSCKSNIIIMGHYNADFDAIGGCLAVRAMCLYLGVKSCKICYEEQLVEANTRAAINMEYTEEERAEMFVSAKDLKNNIHDNTLLVMVDHNEGKLSMFPSFVNEFDNIAIIDHHRASDISSFATVFKCIDTSASSTCEILTDYITYAVSEIDREKIVDDRVATFLLAGICLDTNFYKEHVSDLTFNCSSLLRSLNGDGEKVVEFLKEDFDEYRQKISIIDNSEIPKPGIFIALGPENEFLSDVMISKVADEARAIKDVVASFCIAKVDENNIKISARSDGTVNVAFIMEKLGGGGRFTVAACKITGPSIQFVKDRLYKVLDDYLDDATMQKNDDVKEL